MLWCVVGCHEPHEGDDALVDAAIDGRVPALDEAVDVAPPATDAAPDGGVAPAACTRDALCGAQAYCGAEGLCVEAAASPAFDWLRDGLTRAAAAQFDLTPALFEPWVDRAGEGCPGNRLGVFDGRLDTPDPEDACRDGFTDADGDGWLDAVWLGGGGLDRPAAGVVQARPPEGRVLVLARDDTLVVLVTLDAYALDASRRDALVDRLVWRLGLPREAFAIHTTGTRSGPDLVGLWGPSPAAAGFENAPTGGVLADLPALSGVDADGWAALAPAIAAAVRQAGAELVPVAARAVEVTLPVGPAGFEDGAVPDADGDGVSNDSADLAAWRTEPGVLARDSRLPPTVDRTARAISLDGLESGQPRVVLAGWSAAPTLAEGARLDADYPGAARAHLEAMTGAVAVWLTGAAADTWRAGGVVPAVDAEGRMVDVEGEPVDDPVDAAAADDRVDALGRLIAARLRAALAEAESTPTALAVSRRFAWVPVENPRVVAAAHLGLLPHLRDRVQRRAVTDAWSTVPGCGVGCGRHRLDRIELAPGVVVLTTPGALDRAFVDGRREERLWLGDALGLRDLDFDGQADADDDALIVEAQSGEALVAVTMAGPANPQRFPALDGLARSGAWVVGRTNGGLGSLRTRDEAINVFEGQLGPLAGQDGVMLCSVWPCTELALGGLIERLRSALPATLADLPGSHELRLVAPAPVVMDPVPWQIETAAGGLRVYGERAWVGPRDRVVIDDADLIAARVEVGDVLVLDALDAEVAIAEVVPVELRRHPNAGDAWRSAAPGGGDVVYNTACELLYGGMCPARRAVPDDPNAGLPRTPTP